MCLMCARSSLVCDELHFSDESFFVLWDGSTYTAYVHPEVQFISFLADLQYSSERVNDPVIQRDIDLHH